MNVNGMDFNCGSFSNDIPYHLPIFLLSKIKIMNTCINSNNSDRPHIPKLTEYSLHSLQYDLHNTDWSSLYGLRNVDVAYATFLNKLICLCDKNKTIKSKICKPWISVTLMCHIRKKKRLSKKFYMIQNASNELR